MEKNRLEAFSDGVLAIIITIMVLELKVPHAAELADLKELFPVFLSYVLSFIYVGIYWNNHHHLFLSTRQVTGGILWANLHLLFWLSLFPFTTAWMGENHLAPPPVAVYGFVLLMAALACDILQRTIVAATRCSRRPLGRTGKANFFRVLSRRHSTRVREFVDRQRPVCFRRFHAACAGSPYRTHVGGTGKRMRIFCRCHLQSYHVAGSPEMSNRWNSQPSSSTPSAASTVSASAAAAVATATASVTPAR